MAQNVTGQPNAPAVSSGWCSWVPSCPASLTSWCVVPNCCNDLSNKVSDCAKAVWSFITCPFVWVIDSVLSLCGRGSYSAQAGVPVGDKDTFAYVPGQENALIDSIKAELARVYAGKAGDTKEVYEDAQALADIAQNTVAQLQQLHNALYVAPPAVAGQPAPAVPVLAGARFKLVDGDLAAGVQGPAPKVLQVTFVVPQDGRSQSILVPVAQGQAIPQGAVAPAALGLANAQLAQVFIPKTKVDQANPAGSWDTATIAYKAPKAPAAGVAATAQPVMEDKKASVYTRSYNVALAAENGVFIAKTHAAELAKTPVAGTAFTAVPFEIAGVPVAGFANSNVIAPRVMKASQIAHLEACAETMGIPQAQRADFAKAMYAQLADIRAVYAGIAPNGHEFHVHAVAPVAANGQVAAQPGKLVVTTALNAVQAQGQALLAKGAEVLGRLGPTAVAQANEPSFVSSLRNAGVRLEPVTAQNGQVNAWRAAGPIVGDAALNNVPALVFTTGAAPAAAAQAPVAIQWNAAAQVAQVNVAQTLQTLGQTPSTANPAIAANVQAAATSVTNFCNNIGTITGGQAAAFVQTANNGQMLVWVPTGVQLVNQAGGQGQHLVQAMANTTFGANGFGVRPATINPLPVQPFANYVAYEIFRA